MISHCRFINPVVVAPTIAGVGLAFFTYGFPQAGSCVEISIPQILLVLIFTLVGDFPSRYCTVNLDCLISIGLWFNILPLCPSALLSFSPFCLQICANVLALGPKNLHWIYVALFSTFEEYPSLDIEYSGFMRYVSYLWISWSFINWILFLVCFIGLQLNFIQSHLIIIPTPSFPTQMLERYQLHRYLCANLNSHFLQDNSPWYQMS